MDKIKLDMDINGYNFNFNIAMGLKPEKTFGFQN